jgi:hypothetical protein
MNVIGIVIKYLKENDFDGLLCEDADCGCGLDDLAPCGEYDARDCKPAIEVVPPDVEYDRYFAIKGWDKTDRIKITQK